MAEPRTNESMEKIVSLCKRRGFIFQSSEIYGGINGFWDYGPLGAELKRNVKELWWRSMTQDRGDVAGLEATIIMHPKVWEASGHTSTFSDPMVDCLLTKKRFRADQIEPQSGVVFHFCDAVEAAAAISNANETIHSLPDGEQKEALLGGVQKAVQLLRNALKVPRDKVVQPMELVGAFINKYGRRGRSLERSFSVLVASETDSARAERVAQQFYEQQELIAPIPRLAKREPVKNSKGFNPEEGPGKGAELTPPRLFNLMFKTYVGPVESEENIAYLRPETAQAIFAQFKTVLEVSRQKVPFGICQIGKAFRNEINPRNFTFRSREFEQMELEFFIRPDEVVQAIYGRVASAGEVANLEPRTTNNQQPTTPDTTAWGWEAWHKYWVEQRIRWYENIGLPRSTLVEYWQKQEELAHYARATVDILFKFPFSKRDDQGELTGEELEGIAARSDFDLSQHQRSSGKPMGVFDEELKVAWAKLDETTKKDLWRRYHDARLKYLTKSGVPAEQAARDATADADGLAKGQYIPHVIEPSAGVDRLLLALICHAYSEDQAPDEKGKPETRVVMRFHPRVAPIKVAIFPLLKNRPELVRKAGEVRELLRPHMTVFYDEVGAIGRRYRRQDEAGTPFGVTIDFDTLGEKGPELKDTVTLRDRDSMRQERVRIGDLLPLLLEKVR